MSLRAEAAHRATARFEALLDQCERARVVALPFDDLTELGRLYRRHLARLARLRAERLDVAAIAHLNALCVRAHTALYVPATRSLLARTRATIPDTIARTWRVQVLAWVLLLGGMVVGAGLVAHDAGAVRALVPSGMCRSPDELDALATSAAARAEFLERHETAAASNLAFGSILFAHNTRVGLLAFAAGILAGVPTVLLTAYNGVIVGAYAGMFLHDPWPIEFFAWILPHGIPELTAIVLCAAGGLLLGGAVAVPGRRARTVAVREAVPPALALVLAAVPLFLLAAATESFVRESMLGTGTRLAVAAVYTSALAGGLVWVRRLARRIHIDTRWLAELMPRPRRASPDSGSRAAP